MRVLLMVLCCWLLGAAAADVVPQRQTRPVYQVAQGQLLGAERMGVISLLGVPYAAPPVGTLRWQPPAAPRPWRGLRSAARLSPACLQGEGPEGSGAVSGREDCLYLNIYKPTGVRRPPVMFWIHGGFFTGGASNMFDGSALARQFGVAVVTVNYRVGIMGFLAARGVSEGNLGLMDMQAALRWLQQNAQTLDLDASNITAFGNSAGAAAICALMTLPSSQGLFHKAILQSGSCGSWYFLASLEQAQAKNQRYVDALGCRPLSVRCLGNLPSSKLTSIAIPTSRLIDAVPLPIVYGGAFLPQDPRKALAQGQMMRIPVLLGSNKNEGRVLSAYISLFGLPMNESLYWLTLNALDQSTAAHTFTRYPVRESEAPAETAARMFTDRLFACPVLSLAQLLAPHMPVYQYEFDDPKAPSVVRETPNYGRSGLGAFHGSELTYIFGSSVRGISNIEQLSPQQQRLSWRMGQLWTDFAKTGRAPWPVQSSAGEEVYTLAPERHAAGLTDSFAKRHHCGFWQGVDP